MTDIHAILREDLKELISSANVLQGRFIAFLLIALYLISTVNYLLFHGIIELAGIAAAFSLFIIIWNTRRVITDGFSHHQHWSGTCSSGNQSVWILTTIPPIRSEEKIK